MCIDFKLKVKKQLLLNINLFFFIDIPSKPGAPEPVDWDVDRVSLKWAPPKSTGGAPITGYIVEQRDKTTGVWEEALTTTVSEREILIFKILYLKVFRNSYLTCK